MLPPDITRILSAPALEASGFVSCPRSRPCPSFRRDEGHFRRRLDRLQGMQARHLSSDRRADSMPSRSPSTRRATRAPARNPIDLGFSWSTPRPQDTAHPPGLGRRSRGTVRKVPAECQKARRHLPDESCPRELVRASQQPEASQLAGRPEEGWRHRSAEGRVLIRPAEARNGARSERAHPGSTLPRPRLAPTEHHGQEHERRARRQRSGHAPPVSRDASEWP